MSDLKVKFHGILASNKDHSCIEVDYQDTRLLIQPTKKIEGINAVVICDIDPDEWSQWKYYADNDVPIYSTLGVKHYIPDEQLRKVIKVMGNDFKIGNLKILPEKTPVAPHEPMIGLRFPQFRVAILPELPPYLGQQLIKDISLPPHHLIAGIGSYSKPDHKINFINFADRILACKEHKGLLSITLTNFRLDLLRRKDEVLKRLRKDWDIPILFAKKGMVLTFTRDGKLIKGDQIKSKLHLEEFRNTGMDYDLKHPETRWREIMADARYCLPENSFVLLANGRICPVEEVKKDDELYAGSPTKIVKVYKRKAKEELIKIKPFGLPPVFLTGNHPVLVSGIKEYSWCRQRLEDIAKKFGEDSKFGRKIERDGRRRAIFYDVNKTHWKLARELRKEDLVCVPLPSIREINEIDLLYYLSGWKETENELLSYKPQKPGEHCLTFPYRFLALDRKLGYVIGLWLAEGDLEGGSGLRLSLNENEIELANDFLIFVKEIFGLNGKITFQPENHSLTVRVHSKALAGLFNRWCGHGAQNKFLPSFAFSAPKDFKLALLDGLLKGDGSNSWGNKKYSGWRLGLTSPSLIFGAWLLLLSLGQFSKISIIKRKDKKKKRIFQLAFRGDLNSVRSHKVFFTDNAVWIPVRAVSVLEYEGELFNYQTTANVYSVPFLVHNCGNVAFPRLLKGEKWGNWTLEDVEKYFAKCIDTLRSVGFVIPEKHDNSSFWKLYWRCKRKGLIKSSPPKTKEEKEEWDRKRDRILKKALAATYFSKSKPAYRCDIDLIESDLKHLGWDKKDLLIDSKADGLRITALKLNGKGYVFVDPADLKHKSPNVSARVPQIVRELQENLSDGTVLDGEFIAMVGNEVIHRTDANSILNSKEDAEKLAPFAFIFVFDVLFFKGKDLRNLPLSERLEYLSKIKASEHIIIERPSHTIEAGHSAFYVRGNDLKGIRRVWDIITKDKGLRRHGKFVRHLAEGVMIKTLDGVYQVPQNKSWAKVKLWREIDGVILDKKLVKGAKKTWNYLLGLDIPKDYVKVLVSMSKKSWYDSAGVLVGKQLYRGKEILDKNGRWVMVMTKTDNTNIQGEIGDILRIAAEEVIKYENEEHPDYPRYSFYIGRPLELVPEKNVSDSLQVLERLSLLEPKRMSIEDLLHIRGEKLPKELKRVVEKVKALSDNQLWELRKYLNER